MKAIADICVIPITGQISVRKEVALAHRLLQEAGLSVALHDYGTNVEGELSTILATVEKIHIALHDSQVPRVHTTIKLGTRTDKIQSLGDKSQAVRDELKLGETP